MWKRRVRKSRENLGQAAGNRGGARGSNGSSVDQGRGRDGGHPSPPAQARARGATAELITAHISDPGRDGQRFYGDYSNRAGVTISSADGHSAGAAADRRPEQDNSDLSREARSTWARLLRNIFEVDPLANCRAICRSETDFRPAFRCLPRVLPRFPCLSDFPLCSRIETLINRPGMQKVRGFATVSLTRGTRVFPFGCGSAALGNLWQVFER
jgi:hypothetical protein